MKNKPLEHCSGCLYPDPLGATHQCETIEHPSPMTPSPKPTKSPKREKTDFRDLLAIPFFMLGTWFLWLAGHIGGRWTAGELLKFINHEIKL